MEETCNSSSRVRRDISKKYYVYVLYSYKDKGLYIGYSTDLRNRLISHASGKNDATKNRLPFKLIHYEFFIDEADAKAREEFLKSGYGRKQLDAILQRTFKKYPKTSSGISDT